MNDGIIVGKYGVYGDNEKIPYLKLSPGDFEGAVILEIIPPNGDDMVEGYYEVVVSLPNGVVIRMGSMELRCIFIQDENTALFDEFNVVGEV